VSGFCQYWRIKWVQFQRRLHEVTIRKRFLVNKEHWLLLFAINTIIYRLANVPSLKHMMTFQGRYLILLMHQSLLTTEALTIKWNANVLTGRLKMQDQCRQSMCAIEAWSRGVFQKCVMQSTMFNSWYHAFNRRRRKWTLMVTNSRHVRTAN